MMSRSKRKTPIAGNTGASSEKEDKQIWHRTFRRKIKSLLHLDDEDAEIMYPEVKEVSNPWLMDKDGKGLYDWDKELEKKIRRK
jgi:hypothetical protein